MLNVRIVVLLIWASCIFLMTCVSNIHDLTNHYTITFAFQDSPDLSKFFSSLPVLTDGFIIQKSGHILAFYLLTVLAQRCFHSYWYSFVFCVLYGFMTEFLQLYFSRGGRLFDVGFDTVGILFGLLYSLIKIHIKRKVPAPEWKDSDFN